jgi:hypothetical protein
VYITCVRARHAEGGDRGGLWVGEGVRSTASCSLELLESVEYLFEARPDVGVLRPAIGSQASPVMRRITGEVCVCVHACVRRGLASASQASHLHPTAGTNTAHMRGSDLVGGPGCRLGRPPGSGGCPRAVSCASRIPTKRCRRNTACVLRERDHRRCQVTQRHENGRRHRRAQAKTGTYHIALFRVFFASEHFRCSLEGGVGAQ